jgi:phytanoyl-CoA hydroxylase
LAPPTGRSENRNPTNVPLVQRAPHPWNHEFTWEDHTVAPTTITREQMAQYDRDGFFVFEDAFDAATLARLDAELSPGDAGVKEFLAQMPGGRYSVAGLDTQTVAPHAVTRSDYAREFVGNAVLAGIARDLVGPDVRLYWEQSVYKQPHSAEPVLWHQDNGYTYTEPQAYLTCWIAITDATPENGCVSVMPGVHREGTLAHRNTPVGEECWGDWDAAVEVPIRAGSIVVFTSLTPHATKCNTTDDVRKAYIVQYAPDGAVAHFGDANAGPPTRTEILADDRRFWIVRDGKY